MTRSEQYAANISMALSNAGMTRHELVAELNKLGCHVTLQAVSGWLTGKYSPTTRNQAAVAKVLRIPPHLLFPVTLEVAA